MELMPARGRMAGAAQMAATIVLAVAASTVAIGVVEQYLHVTYAAPLYLLAVLAVGMRHGTLPALGTAVIGFLAYDFLFVAPLYTFTISDPNEWLNLLLLLVVAVAIGRLVALQAEHAVELTERAGEAQALFGITRALAETRTVEEAAPIVLQRLAQATAMDRIWFGLGSSPVEERVIADTSPGQPMPIPAWQVVLQRSPGDEPARWVRMHVAVSPGRRPSGRVTFHRVRVEAPGESLGSVWAMRARDEREPNRAETRILSAAADQLGQAMVRDRVALERTSAEIARRSDALKTALLDSVSHDLRTPLATIRAAAGSMLDESVAWTEEDHRGAFQAIDSEAERMGRLVRNLLDLSRIEGGALKPELEPCDLADVVGQVVKRARVTPSKRILVELPDPLSPVLVDQLYLGQVLANLLSNALRHTPSGGLVRLAATVGPDGGVLSVTDTGDGIEAGHLPYVFERFYRTDTARARDAGGTGIGLAISSEIARAHGGALTAASPGRDQGATFTLTLPSA